VPSARRVPHLAVLGLCGALAVGSLAGCETTQEKASAQRAESERILDARAKRQAAKKKHEHNRKAHKHEGGRG
jgi:hypothetical protein